MEREDEIPVHQGCDTSMLSFTVDLVEWEIENGITDTTFNRLLNLMKGQLKLTTLPCTSNQTTTIQFTKVLTRAISKRHFFKDTKMLKKWLKVMMTCGDIQAIVRHKNIDQEFDALDGVNPYKSIFTK